MSKAHTQSVKEEEWRQNLRSFLDGLLSRIIPDANIRAKWLTADVMKVWEDCFTHETYSPSDNYEDYEYIGDANLNAVFPRYLRVREPTLHKAEYTELYNQYMSKMIQAELSQELGLGGHVRVRGIDRVILNIDTDVFESFFGGLDVVSEMVYPGSGMNNCYNMIISIFDRKEIDKELAKGSPKTQVIQIFLRFDLPKIDAIVVENARGDNTATIELSPVHMKFLESYTVRLPSNVIGRATAPTKQEAESLAFQQSLKLLVKNGIDSSWAKEAKRNRDISHPEVAPYVPAVNKRLEQDGFIDVNFVIPRKTTTKNGAVVQLVGTRPDGKLELLAFTYGTDRVESYSHSKAKVLRDYAENGKI
jgi:dsRNA-specific ribonuclease